MKVQVFIFEQASLNNSPLYIYVYVAQEANQNPVLTKYTVRADK